MSVKTKSISDGGSRDFLKVARETSKSLKKSTNF